MGKNTTFVSRVLAVAGNEAEQICLAAYGELPPKAFLDVVGVLRSADFDIRTNQDPLRGKIAHGFAVELFKRLVARDAEYFEDLSRAIRFYEKHRGTIEKRGRLKGYDKWMTFLLFERFMRKGRPMSVRQICAKANTPLTEATEKSIRRAAKRIDWKVSGAPGRPRKGDTESKQRCSVS